MMAVPAPDRAPGSVGVDHKSKLGRLLDRQIRWLGAPENAGDKIKAHLMKSAHWVIGHQAASLDVKSLRLHRTDFVKRNAPGNCRGQTKKFSSEELQANKDLILLNKDLLLRYWKSDAMDSPALLREFQSLARNE